MNDTRNLKKLFTMHCSRLILCSRGLGQIAFTGIMHYSSPNKKKKTFLRPLLFLLYINDINHSLNEVIIKLLLMIQIVFSLEKILIL